MWEAVCGGSNVCNYGLFEVVTKLNSYSLTKHSCALLGDLASATFFKLPSQYLPMPAICWFCTSPTPSLFLLLYSLLRVFVLTLNQEEGKPLTPFMHEAVSNSPAPSAPESLGTVCVTWLSALGIFSSDRLFACVMPLQKASQCRVLFTVDSQRALGELSSAPWPQ